MARVFNDSTKGTLAENIIDNWRENKTTSLAGILLNSFIFLAKNGILLPSSKRVTYSPYFCKSEIATSLEEASITPILISPFWVLAWESNFMESSNQHFKLGWVQGII